MKPINLYNRLSVRVAQTTVDDCSVTKLHQICEKLRANNELSVF